MASSFNNVQGNLNNIQGDITRFDRTEMEHFGQVKDKFAELNSTTEKINSVINKGLEDVKKHYMQSSTLYKVQIGMLGVILILVILSFFI